EPDFIGEDGNLDFEKISFDIPILEGEETYGVNFSDEQFGNFEGPIPVDDNFKDKFFNENAEAAFEDLDIDFETDITVAEIKFSGKSDSSLGSELNTKQLNLGGSYDDEVTWTMDDANAFLKVDTACLFGTGVTFEMPQGKMEAPIFTMAQQTNNGNPPIFNLGNSAIATFETMNFGVDGNAEGDISGSLTATTVSFGSDAEMTFDIGAQVNFNSFTMSGILTMDDGALDVENYILAGNMNQLDGTTEIETLNIQEGGTYGIKNNAEVKIKTVERADLLDLSGGSIYAEELNGDTTNKGSNLIVGTLTETSTAQITRVIDFNLATILRQTKVIGNYIQTTSSGSTPNLTTTVYSGNENSQLEVSQTATVGGTLTVQKSSNMVFELNQEFKIVSANSIAGTFSSLNLPTLESGQEWDTSQLYTNGTLAITSSSSDDTATTFDSTIYVYPNPAQVSKGSPTFLYQLQQDSDVKFEVYNMFGHQIYSTQFESGQNGGTLSNQVKIPLLTLNQMPIGVYFVIVHNDTTTLNKGKFTIK
ncbi:MAG: T9SS type A sorting domain-containing protein, partial [Candidatus Margulisiibacteriota bacterium]|nr:T9SS type A sorting domain-containing protein [Candidatus Margulisiibacteriota bacterium]